MAELTGGGKLIQRNASSTTASTESDHVEINMKRTTESSEYDHDLLSENRCIYMVPDHLRKLNENFFPPQVISIGPSHLGNKN